MATSSKITNGSKTWLDGVIETNTLSEKTLGRLGSGTTAAQATDTTLETELAGSEKAWNSVTQAAGVSTFEYHLTFTDQLGETINEIGIFDADGNLHGRVVFSDDTITKDNLNEYYIRVAETSTVTINP